MKTEIKIQTRVYPVELKDARTGEKSSDTIVLTKDQLQAGGLVGMTDEDIIYRIYNRQGYRVMEIGNPQKVELTIDLEKACSARMLQITQERDARDTE